MMVRKFLIVFFVILVKALSVENASANNLSVHNFEVYAVDTAANTITFSCDVSWDNSWKTSNGNDAVWMFLKYSTDAGVNWSHASMYGTGTSPMGWTVPTNFEAVVPNDKKGFFLQRTDYNTSNVAATGLRFVWDYAQDDLTDEAAMAASTINKVFGIEMVYVPQGAFYLGDGNSSSDFHFKQGSSDNDPWYIQSENAINTTNSTNDGYYYAGSGASGENSSGDAFLISNSFPKGFQSIYVMKYELTEGQWVAFFNTLPYAAKVTRDITSSANGGKNSDGVVNRNTISWDSSSSYAVASTLRPDRPVTYISWPDVTAYADWAGLRPITEMEYEKIARGKDIAYVADEFAWGKITYNSAEPSEISPSSDESGSETISDSTANINRNALAWNSGDGRVGGIAESQKGPLRVGIFARNSTNRSLSGAGYYGNMELSGNLYEMVVGVGRPEGRIFLGTHGDGRLSTASGYEGNATNEDWPGINATDEARGVTGTIGSGYRGGDFQRASIREFQTSSRTLASKDPDSQGYNQRYDAAFGVFQGGRLGRTAP